MALEAAYAASSIASSLDGTDIPYSAFKQDIIAQEAELAAMIGNSTNPIFRAALAAQSSALASGATIPTLDANSNPFVGSFDGVFDAGNAHPMTEQPYEIVQRAIDNPGSFWKLDKYIWAQMGTRIYHPRSTIYYRGCSWNRATQETLFDTAPSVAAAFAFVAADVTVAADTITEAAHGIITGTKCRVDKVGATLPAPLTDQMFVWAIYDTVNTLKFATTLTNALTNTPINLTTQGVGTHTITPVGWTGGGSSPLPFELSALLMCKVLANLPQERWFIQEAGVYNNIVQQKQQEIIDGKFKLMTMPSMPITTARAEPDKD